MRKVSKIRQAAVKAGFRSGFEHTVAKQLAAAGHPFEYEAVVLEYVKPPSRYTPDLILGNGILIELKGRLLAADRTKAILVKQQHPHHDIRFVFQNASRKLSPKSKTTYGQWATKHGFQWAEGTIPAEWHTE